MDLPLISGNWTWFGDRTNPSFSRIDRFLVSVDMLSKQLSLTQKVLSRLISDHAPICLAAEGME